MHYFHYHNVKLLPIPFYIHLCNNYLKTTMCKLRRCPCVLASSLKKRTQMLFLIVEFGVRPMTWLTRNQWESIGISRKL